jgi:adenylate cyclase
VDNDGDGRGALTAAGLSCGSCGTQLGATAKFCSECGTPVAHAAQSAEYKQVTVLFADVVHSMEIAAAVGAERLREIMADLVDRAVTVVQRYGGTVDKFTGDGIMAVFGAPVALEDHAIRGCLAALGLQDAAQRLARDVRDLDGVDLRLRVGLNSGQVIAGEIGSGPSGYTAIGEQVGLAQRMESVAPPDGVMLSDSTAKLVGNAVVLSEPDPVRVKGGNTLIARRLLAIGEHQPYRRAQLAALPTDPGFVPHGISLLRLRALVARAGGDETAYRDYRDRYRGLATSLGFEGHIKWAAAMP